MQKRDYCITINNPDLTDIQFKEYLEGIAGLKYAVFQLEEAPTTKTPHFQVYLEFKFGKRFETMKNLFPTAHIEPRKGSRKEAREYCMQEETRLSETFYEVGEFVGDGEKSGIEMIIEMIKEGYSDGEIMDLFPTLYVRHFKTLKSLRQEIVYNDFKNKRRLDLQVTYLYGAPGVGKTRYVMDKFGDANVYRVTDYEHPFDGYSGQDVIVFEEFRSSLPIEDMLNYLDIYPLELPARYGNKVACYTKVFIVTNIMPHKQYEFVQQYHPVTFQAFYRRIHKVIMIREDGKLEIMMDRELTPF